MNDSFIPPRSIRVFDDKHEAFKAKRKFLRHQREKKKRKEKLQA